MRLDQLDHLVLVLLEESLAVRLQMLVHGQRGTVEHAVVLIRQPQRRRQYRRALVEIVAGTRTRWHASSAPHLARRWLRHEIFARTYRQLAHVVFVLHWIFVRSARCQHRVSRRASVYTDLVEDVADASLGLFQVSHESIDLLAEI